MDIERSTMSRLGQGREEQLQFLRFLAFLNVYIYHAEQWLIFQYPASHCASAAVSFFFMLSGLVCGYAYQAGETELSLRGCGSFLWKKLVKLYPLYICMAVFTILYSGLPEEIAFADVEAIRASLRQFLRTVLLIQSWFQEGYYDFNGVGWFLSTLMFLYAITLPAMTGFQKVKHRRRGNVVLVMLMGGLLVGTTAYCYLTQKRDMGYWHYIFPPARMGEYLVGMILGLLLREAKKRISGKRGITLLCTLLEVVALLYWYRSLSAPGNYWRNHIVSWLVPNIVLLSVFTVGAGGISKIFRCPVLVGLGDASFACYLIHQVIIRLYSDYHVVGSNIRQRCVAFWYCLGLSVVLSCLLCQGQKKKKRAAA